MQVYDFTLNPLHGARRIEGHLGGQDYKKVGEEAKLEVPWSCLRKSSATRTASRIMNSSLPMSWGAYPANFGKSNSCGLSEDFWSLTLPLRNLSKKWRFCWTWTKPACRDTQKRAGDSLSLAIPARWPKTFTKILLSINRSRARIESWDMRKLLTWRQNTPAITLKWT